MKNISFISLFLIVANIVLGQDTTTLPKQWSLQDCLNYAIENNITISNTILDQENADVQYKQARFQRLPSLSANASQNFSNGNSIDPITSDYVSQQVHSTSMGLNTQVMLFQGNQINNQIKQRKLEVDLSSYNLEEAENNVILNVTEAYIQALYYKEGIKIASDNLALSEAQFKLAEAQYKAGMHTQKDFLDAQSLVASNKYNSVLAQNSFAQQLLVLKQLLELGPIAEFDIENANTEKIDLPNIPNQFLIYEYALANLPEIKASIMNLDISKLDLSISKGGYWPTLSLSGSLGTGYTNTRDIDFSEQFNLNFNQRIGLNLSIPIFNKYNTKAKVQTAQINIERYELQLTTAQKQLYRIIENAWLNATSSQKQYLSAIDALAAAEASYLQAQKQYEVGALITIGLVQYQNAYLNAQQNLLQAKYMSILYYQLLQFYQGYEIKL